MKNIPLLFLAITLTACTFTMPDASTDSSSGSSGGPAADLQTAPDFDLASLAGGTLNSEDLKGKVLVVDFWATWCQPCIEEIPNFNELHLEQDSENFAMLAVTVESGPIEDVEPYIERLEIQYPVVMGDEAVVQGFGGLIGFPTTFVVSPDWKIYKKYLGMKVGKKELIEQDVIDLMGAPQAATGF